MLNKKLSAPIISLAIFSLVLFPFIANAGLVLCGTSEHLAACNFCDLFILVETVIYFLMLEITLPLAVIALLYGGIMWITAGGDEAKITKGRNAIKYAVYGMIVAFGAWLIIDTVLKALLSGGMGEIQGWGPWNKIPSCS
ncbi:MAG TPA: hypothetical protein ENG99_01340 [bacterium]|nr:hypothetical protein [bacterium]